MQQPARHTPPSDYSHQPQTRAEKSNNPLITESLNVIRLFFSMQPLDATQKATSIESPIWIVFLGAYGLSEVLFLRTLLNQLFDNLFLGDELSEVLAFVTAYSLVYNVILFATILAFLTWIHSRVSPETWGITRLNLIGSALLMPTVINVLALVLAIIHTGVAGFVHIIGLPVWFAYTIYSIKEHLYNRVSGFCLVAMLLIAMAISVGIAEVIVPSVEDSVLTLVSLWLP